MDTLKLMKLFSEKNLIEAKIKAAVIEAEKKAINAFYQPTDHSQIKAYECIQFFKKEMGEFLQKEFGGII